MKTSKGRLTQGPAGPGVTADPTTGTSGAARDYDLPRGVDIHGYWYRSPGDKATGGNPGRPDDPAAYIGLTAPVSSGEPATEEPASAPAGAEVSPPVAEAQSQLRGFSKMSLYERVCRRILAESKAALGSGNVTDRPALHSSGDPNIALPD